MSSLFWCEFTCCKFSKLNPLFKPSPSALPIKFFS
uniref:Uncharacterized protein LOC8284443 n=1 Tax=Rhizophora mucronata TaxID=61149 RepID=A0A2P2NI65_RHIMU